MEPGTTRSLPTGQGRVERICKVLEQIQNSNHVNKQSNQQTSAGNRPVEVPESNLGTTERLQPGINS